MNKHTKITDANNLTESQRFGQLLAYLRQQAGLKQTELAAIVDSNRQCLSRLENGKHSTNLDLMALYLKVLGYKLTIEPINSDNDMEQFTQEEADAIYLRIGQRLKELREQRGLSPADLAEKLGCKPTLIVRIENGRYKCNVTTMEIIANFLNATLEVIEL